MAGKPTAAHDKARAAFEKSGGTLSAAAMAKRYKLALSTAYRIQGIVRQEQEKAKQAAQ
jgi:hypothetical protein